MKSFNIPVTKINSNVTVAFQEFNDEVKEYVIEYGLRQILNDCHSQINRNWQAAEGKSDEEFNQAVQDSVDAKLQSLIEGNVRQNRVSDGTPVEYTKLAYQYMANVTGHKIKDLKAKAADQKWTTPEMLKRVCGAVKSDYATVDAEIKTTLAENAKRGKADAKKVDIESL